MPYIVLLVLVVFVYFDARLLKRQNEEQYQSCLKSSPLNWAVSCLLFFVVAIFIYLWRRHQYKKARDRQLVFAVTSERQLSDCLGIIVSWSALALSFSLLVNFSPLWSTVVSTELGEVVLLTLIENILLIVLIFQATKNYPSGGFFKAVGLRKVRKRLTWHAVAVSVLIGLGFAFVASFERITNLNQPDTPLNDLLERSSSSASIVFFIFTAILLIPLFEELIFRGYFYGILKRLKGKVFAIVAVALSFALLHVGQYWGDWYGIAMITALGFVLSLLRAFNGITLPGIITHYVYNAFVFIFPVLIMLQMNPAYFQYEWKYRELDSRTKETLLLKSIQDQPQWHVAYNDLAWLYAQEKIKLRDALTLCDKALAFDPDNNAYLDTKAEVLYQLKRYPEAIIIERKLVAKNPGDKFYKAQLKKFRKAFRKPRTDAHLSL